MRGGYGGETGDSRNRKIYWLDRNHIKTMILYDFNGVLSNIKWKVILFNVY